MLFARTLNVCLLAAAAVAATPTHLETLVRAERDFARLSVERGMREAFLANFAEDGIWFTPHPERTREALGKRPAAPRTHTLDWYPTWGGASRAGDLGYTTGPYTISDLQKKPVERGYFFSVWRRTDAGWKVAVDFGVEGTERAPEEAKDAKDAWRPSRSGGFAGEPDVEAAGAALRAREKALAQGGAAVEEALAEDFRVYRPNELPYVTRPALRSLLGREGVVTFDPTSVEVSRSADLAYAWGTYARADEKGYFVHVWCRNAAGEWRLAVEVRKKL